MRFVEPQALQVTVPLSHREVPVFALMWELEKRGCLPLRQRIDHRPDLALAAYDRRGAGRARRPYYQCCLSIADLFGKGQETIPSNLSTKWCSCVAWVWNGVRKHFLKFFWRDGTGRDGTRTQRDGMGRDRTGRDGTGRDRTRRDGTGRDGTGRDGTGRVSVETER